jgi:hypothetical protein
MLWTIRRRWAAGSRFAFNCYRHATQLVLRRKGSPGYTLLSSEGVTQGDLLSNGSLRPHLLPLAKKLWQEHPEAVQAWYEDIGLLKGRTSQVAAAMTLIQRLGPERRYFPEPAKSIYICTPGRSLQVYPLCWQLPRQRCCPIAVARAPDPTMGLGRRIARQGCQAVPSNRLCWADEVTPAGLAVPTARRAQLQAGV